MGLPLYYPPVESDLRKKTLGSRPADRMSRIRRIMHRRDSEGLRESRRRAILAEAAAPFATSFVPLENEHEQRQRLQNQNQNQNQNPQGHVRLEQGPQSTGNLARDLEARSQVRPSMAPESGPLPTGDQSQEQVRDQGQQDQSQSASNETRLRQQERVRLVLGREVYFNSMSESSRESFLQRFLDRIQEQEQRQTDRHEQTSPAHNDAIAEVTTAISSSLNPVPFSESATRRHLRRLVENRARLNSANGASSAPLDSDSFPAAIASINSNAIGEDTDVSNEEFNSHLFEVLNHEFAQPPVRAYHRWAADGPYTNDGSDQLYRPTADHFMDFDELDRNTDVDSNRPSHRRASSLRRGTNTSNSSRRPTVGWSDNTSRAGSHPQASSTSRIFGDISRIDHRNGTPPTPNERPTPEAATARRHGWAVRYIDANNNPYLPSMNDLSGSQVDGLGDRRRSLSLEGDGVWDTLLTTLTPDPQPPSVGSSFASSSDALAAAAADGPATSSSSQPAMTLTPAVSAPPAVPSPAARHEDETEDITPAPLLVEASRTQPGASGAVSRSASASGGDGSSGTTSASASQRIQSPFTVVSANTDTSTETGVLDGPMPGEEETCEDSEMDEDDEDEEEQAAFLGLSSGTSDGRRPHFVRPGDISQQIQNLFHFQNRVHSTHAGPGDISSGNRRGGHRYHTEESLDLLGIGGMQHIVRSLARREDIPDEWWAEAGLSRTLPREASN